MEELITGGGPLTARLRPAVRPLIRSFKARARLDAAEIVPERQPDNELSGLRVPWHSLHWRTWRKALIVRPDGRTVCWRGTPLIVRFRSGRECKLARRLVRRAMMRAIKSGATEITDYFTASRVASLSSLAIQWLMAGVVAGLLVKFAVVVWSQVPSGTPAVVYITALIAGGPLLAACFIVWARPAIAADARSIYPRSVTVSREGFACVLSDGDERRFSWVDFVGFVRSATGRRLEFSDGTRVCIHPISRVGELLSEIKERSGDAGGWARAARRRHYLICVLAAFFGATGVYAAGRVAPGPLTMSFSGLIALFAFLLLLGVIIVSLAGVNGPKA